MKFLLTVAASASDRRHRIRGKCSGDVLTNRLNAEALLAAIRQLLHGN
jgi:hypothetical protein